MRRYDTAVVRHEELPNEADAAFGDMVGQVKRRDGKRKVDLLALFLPPPPPTQPSAHLSASQLSERDSLTDTAHFFAATETASSAPASDDEEGTDSTSTTISTSAAVSMAVTPSKLRARRPAVRDMFR